MCARAIQLRLYIDEWLAQEIALKEPTNNYSNRSNHSINNDSNPDTTEANYRDLKQLRLSATEWHHLYLVTTLLKKFKDATTDISQNQTP
jgi:hypothetical protein